ncbi:MAG: amidophosphoribosyltransferase [Ignavibacteriales bacterium]|nr:amidophosphoribosyltransferase [Ignavibacteriales bacterium]
MEGKPRCHCGIFGIFGHPEASVMTYYGLHALQHRGQEATGIVTSEYLADKKKWRFNFYRGIGLVTDVFKDEEILKSQLKGSSAIGHNRYSTTGSADNKSNIQPFVVNYKAGNLALGHNGNLTNFHTLREQLQSEGTIFQSTSDSEVILHLAARSKKSDQIFQVKEALDAVEGAYSLVILTDDSLIAARDPYGFRPLALGKLGKAYVVASETCAFDIIGAEYIRDVQPGEILVIDNDGLATGKLQSHWITKKKSQPYHCIFEYIYFSRPDSKIFGESVDKVRRKLGKLLAQESPVKPDDKEDRVIVISVPDSSNTATLGYVSEANKMGDDVRLEIGLIRSHYVGRTFIQPGQTSRELKVKTKFNTVKGVIKGRKVVIVDDSIVRGTTSKQLVKLIREAEPKEIHFRVTSPPIKFPCHYGMDFPSKEELIANRCNSNIDEIAKELGVDSLAYLSMDKLLEAAPNGNGTHYCTACFSGNYPVAIDKELTKDANDT